MKLVQLTQGSTEWFDYRYNHIMATDSVAIMRQGKKTPLQLYTEKIKKQSSVKENAAMQRGRLFEPYARQLFIEQTGIQVAPQVAESGELPWAAASLDGMSSDCKTVVEIKVHSPELYYDVVKNKQPPSYYIPQMQKQIFVCELDFLFYFPYDGTRGEVIKIYRDDEYISKMLEEEKRFWDHLCNQIPPPECEDDFVKIDNPVFIDLAQAYINVKNRMALLKIQEEELKQEIVMRAGDHNISGGGIRVQKIIRSGNIDYKSIPEIQAIDLNQYRKEPIEFWQIKEIA